MLISSITYLKKYVREKELKYYSVILIEKCSTLNKKKIKTI
jgi:hypothetical protein